MLGAKVIKEQYGNSKGHNNKHKRRDFRLGVVTRQKFIKSLRATKKRKRLFLLQFETRSESLTSRAELWSQPSKRN